MKKMNKYDTSIAPLTDKELSLIASLSQYLFKVDITVITNPDNPDEFYGGYDVLAHDILAHFHLNRKKGLDSFEMFRAVYDASFYNGATKDWIESTDSLEEFKQYLSELNQSVSVLGK